MMMDQMFLSRNLPPATQQVHPSRSNVNSRSGPGPLSYTVVNIDENEDHHQLRTSLQEGRFHELNCAYCDKDNQHFRVFETHDGIKFIYGMSPHSPGVPVPMILSPVPNQLPLQPPPSLSFNPKNIQSYPSPPPPSQLNHHHQQQQREYQPSITNYNNNYLNYNNHPPTPPPPPPPHFPISMNMNLNFTSNENNINTAQLFSHTPSNRATIIGHHHHHHVNPYTCSSLPPARKISRIYTSNNINSATGNNVCISPLSPGSPILDCANGGSTPELLHNTQSELNDFINNNNSNNFPVNSVNSNCNTSGNVTNASIKIVGMRKFLLEAIQEEMARSTPSSGSPADGSPVKNNAVEKEIGKNDEKAQFEQPFSNLNNLSQIPINPDSNNERPMKDDKSMTFPNGNSNYVVNSALSYVNTNFGNSAVEFMTGTGQSELVHSQAQPNGSRTPLSKSILKSQSRTLKAKRDINSDNNNSDFDSQNDQPTSTSTPIAPIKRIESKDSKPKPGEDIEQLKNRVVNYLNATSQILPVKKANMSESSSQCSPSILRLDEKPQEKTEVEQLVQPLQSEQKQNKTSVAVQSPKRILKFPKILEKDVEVLTGSGCGNIIKTCLRSRLVENRRNVDSSPAKGEMDLLHDILHSTNKSHFGDQRKTAKNVSITEPSDSRQKAKEHQDKSKSSVSPELENLKKEEDAKQVDDADLENDKNIKKYDTEEQQEEEKQEEQQQEEKETDENGNKKEVNDGDQEEEIPLPSSNLKKRVSETGESVTSEEFYSNYLDKSSADVQSLPIGIVGLGFGSEGKEEIHEDIIDALKKYQERYGDPSSAFPYPRSFALRANQDLTKLVLQRVADDTLLEVIGKTTSSLKYLDVSGSTDVTNEGIQHLFIKRAKENSSLYLMSSWVHKNIKVMNKVVTTLEYLDYSYTKANFYSRRFVNLLPGSYVFQRIFRLGDDDYFGHHIFYRRNPDFASCCKGPEKNNDFEIQLRLAVGTRGASHFTKFIEHHGWRSCYAAIRDSDKCRKIPIKFKQPITGIITASKDEKRVYGEVAFENGNLVSLYSLFPADINAIGEYCPNLQTLSALLYNTWKRKGIFLPALTKIDAIAEPSTIVSIFQNCPSLKYLRIRVKDGTLCDEDLIKAVKNSLSTKNLKEIWLVPGFFKPSQCSKTCPCYTTTPITTTNTSPQPPFIPASRKHSDVLTRKDRSSSICNGNVSANASFGMNNTTFHVPGSISNCNGGVGGTGTGTGVNNRKISTINENILIDGIELKRDANELNESSCKLSINAAKILFWSCPDLIRLGNLALWQNVTKDDYEKFNEDMTKGDTYGIFIEWGSILMSDLDLSSGWDG